jgi:hypothetical protein
MCFSQKISLTFAILGAILTIISYKKKQLHAKYFYLLVLFYTIMELLQTIQYSYVNQCESKMNILLTNFAYILVIVQPLLWNLYFYVNSDDQNDKNIFKVAIVFALIWMIYTIILRILYNPKQNKNNICGFFNNDKTCTYRDTTSSHLYWKWTTAYYKDVTPNFFMYLCIWFIPALLVKHTQKSALALILSTFIGLIYTLQYGATIYEFPSIWCFISIPFIAFGFL